MYEIGRIKWDKRVEFQICFLQKYAETYFFLVKSSGRLFIIKLVLIFPYPCKVSFTERSPKLKRKLQ